MTRELTINLVQLARVEGHGSIVVDIKEGKVKQCQWRVIESPRFFEAMMRGRHYSTIARIASRICGICSVGHSLASSKATEVALGIEVTPQTEKLRRLIKYAEMFDSHIVHIYFLVAPDVFGSSSILTMEAKDTEIVKRALRYKRFGHEWGKILTGRTTHPLTIIPGGFSKLPSEDDLITLKKMFEDIFSDIEYTLTKRIPEVMRGKVPDFDRPTEYISISSDDEYALYDGKIQSIMPDKTKEQYNPEDYLVVTNEHVVPSSTAKYTSNKLDSYMVGSLARVNNNFEKLHPKAQKLAKALGVEPLCTNPYLNTVAQVVECYHCLIRGRELIEELLSEGIRQEDPMPPTKFAQGMSATEVPRGMLVHDYAYDKDGTCKYANCIIPTNQNHANIQHDIGDLVSQLVSQGKEKAEIELALEMLVRAYDPCISCSTHYLDVKFV